VIATSRQSHTKRSICCHCDVFCGILVEVDEEGLPTRVQGDHDHPTTRGFLCRRGQAAIEYFNHPARLNQPLRRVGARGSGEFERVSWDEALDAIADRLLTIRDESGPEAVAHLNGTYRGADSGFGARLLHKLGSPNAGGTGLMCAGPMFAGGALTFGFGSAAPEVLPGTTGVVLLWGRHPSASSPPFWGKVRDAMREGATLIVVDPRPTLEARQAQLVLAPRPGTDAALALGLVHVVLIENLWDRGFVDRWVTGLDALEQRVQAFFPERVEELTGVPAADVRRAAQLYAGARSAALAVGKPNGQGRNALNLERSLAILISITGNLDRPGGNRLFGPAPDVGSETTYDAYDELPPAQRRKRIGAERFRIHGAGLEMLNEDAERVWYGIPNPVPRRVIGIAHPPSVFRAILTGEPYQVRAALVQNHNPVGAYAGSSTAYEALRSPRLDLLVVHELFLTPTAMLADYVLPAAHWLEKPFLLSQGWGSPVLTGAQVTAPQHERRSDYELCRDLGRRLAQEWPETVEDVWDEWLRTQGLTYAELVASDSWWLASPAERQRHEAIDPGTGQPYGFATPSGKIELSSNVLAALGYDPLPSFDEGAAILDDDYPLRLMTGATRIDATHQDHRQIASLRRSHPDPVVEIDPETATDHEIEDGDWVRITTPRGSFRQRARMVPGLGRDRVNAERWWYPERPGAEPTYFGLWESNVNAYTEDDLELCDPIFGALPYRLARCRIARERQETHASTTS
jgi:thiosulfate reductase/polysulfide reductase chain A